MLADTGNDWNAILQRPTLFFYGAFVVAIVAMVAPQWRRVRQAQAEARLKQMMIGRGFSADEIERVIRTEGSPSQKRTTDFVCDGTADVTDGMI